MTTNKDFRQFLDELAAARTALKVGKKVAKNAADMAAFTGGFGAAMAAPEAGEKLKSGDTGGAVKDIASGAYDAVKDTAMEPVRKWKEGDKLGAFGSAAQFVSPAAAITGLAGMAAMDTETGRSVGKWIGDNVPYAKDAAEGAKKLRSALGIKSDYTQEKPKAEAPKTDLPKPVEQPKINTLDTVLKAITPDYKANEFRAFSSGEKKMPEKKKSISEALAEVQRNAEALRTQNIEEGWADAARAARRSKTKPLHGEKTPRSEWKNDPGDKRSKPEGETIDLKANSKTDTPVEAPKGPSLKSIVGGAALGAGLGGAAMFASRYAIDSRNDGETTKQEAPKTGTPSEPAKTEPAKQEAPKPSFKDAFLAARKAAAEKGAKSTGQFEYEGKKYQTNIKGEKYVPMNKQTTVSPSIPKQEAPKPTTVAPNKPITAAPSTPTSTPAPSAGLPTFARGLSEPSVAPLPPSMSGPAPTTPKKKPTVTEAAAMAPPPNVEAPSPAVRGNAARLQGQTYYRGLNLRGGGTASGTQVEPTRARVEIRRPAPRTYSASGSASGSFSPTQSASVNQSVPKFQSSTSGSATGKLTAQQTAKVNVTKPPAATAAAETGAKSGILKTLGKFAGKAAGVAGLAVDPDFGGLLPSKGETTSEFERQAKYAPKATETPKAQAPSTPKTSSPATPKEVAPKGDNMGKYHKSNLGNYTVKSGDTLSKIAAKNKTTTADLAKQNNIKDVNKIAKGGKIFINTPKPPIRENNMTDEINEAPLMGSKQDFDSFRNINKNATYGQYLNSIRGLSARKGGANDPSVIQKKFDSKTRPPLMPKKAWDGNAMSSNSTEAPKQEAPKAEAPKTDTRDSFLKSQGIGIAGTPSQTVTPVKSITTDLKNKKPVGPSTTSFTNESENPFIAAFLKLQETKSGNIFETAKKNKALAALAEPKDKITRKDVLVGRGVFKEADDPSYNGGGDVTVTPVKKKVATTTPQPTFSRSGSSGPAVTKDDKPYINPESKKAGMGVREDIEFSDEELAHIASILGEE